MGPWIRSLRVERVLNARMLAVAGGLVAAGIVLAAIAGDSTAPTRPAPTAPAAAPIDEAPAASEACREVRAQLESERARARAYIGATEAKAQLDREVAAARDAVRHELDEVIAALDDRSRHRPRGRVRRDLLARFDQLHAELEATGGRDGFVCGNELEEERRQLARRLELERQRVDALADQLAACERAGR